MKWEPEEIGRGPADESQGPCRRIAHAHAGPLTRALRHPPTPCSVFSKWLVPPPSFHPCRRVRPLRAVQGSPGRGCRNAPPGRRVIERASSACGTWPFHCGGTRFSSWRLGGRRGRQVAIRRCRAFCPTECERSTARTNVPCTRGMSNEEERAKFSAGYKVGARALGQQFHRMRRAVNSMPSRHGVK